MIEYVGREFEMGTSDCYGLLRDYYQNEFGIELPNYARPDEFWHQGLDLYSGLYMKTGFEPIHVPQREWRHVDAVLMAILAPFANHVGIVMENGQILHHMFGRLSAVDDYKGIWRNSTVGTFRYPGVVLKEEVQLLDIREALNASPE